MTAIIPVNRQYRIELDALSWQVSKWRSRTKHPGGGAYEGVTWHGSLQLAGESLVVRLVGEADVEGVDAVIDALFAASRLVAAAIKDSPWPDSWQAAKAALAAPGG